MARPNKRPWRKFLTKEELSEIIPMEKRMAEIWGEYCGLQAKRNIIQNRATVRAGYRMKLMRLQGRSASRADT